MQLIIPNARGKEFSITQATILEKLDEDPTGLT